MFERAHHRRVAWVLEHLDAELLRSLHCWFGGSTAIALRCGEFRESVGVDFLVSEQAGYRELRQRMRGTRNLLPLARPGAPPIALENEARVDQYGIHAFVLVDGMPIKFEIISEGRISLDTPSNTDVTCGVATLTSTDLAASKLLANSDRWSNDSVFARDAIDLAMLDLPPRRLAPALEKAVSAYGPAVVDDMHAALRRLREHPEWLRRCLEALSIHLPPASVQQKLRLLARRLTNAAGRLA
ncbi:nucleotidyl transferase AbiEii/AbiGii toxin family protein [Pseudoxanthomonas koreensis]|uniref:nucleotidyl transferase AbiEii/AbiGii toxin family protein n=1 Tax=Pseudoxanthomonas koreensis TaxID=266061 RepID=UPI001391B5A4|nr:nucleotidyl transferase AbiEii/AbiGii toxin family protein [Pseudoxanthomonas koreensis]KAF1695315.1 hypothetical protein CSC64_03445 [Pseudoxanthomonas koreensis]